MTERTFTSVSRRDLIMTNALKLFGRNGFAETSVGMIASAAGVSQGLLYTYFDSKEALLRAIFDQSMADVRESFAIAESAEPVDRVEQLIRAAFAVVRRNLDFWRLSYSVRMQSAVLASLGGALPAWTAEIRRTLTRYLRECGVPEPELEAALLFATIDGVSQHFVLEPNRYPLDAIAERIVSRYRTLCANAPVT